MKMKSGSNSKQKSAPWKCPSYREYGTKGVSGPSYSSGGAAKVVGKASGYGCKGV